MATDIEAMGNPTFENFYTLISFTGIYLNKSKLNMTIFIECATSVPSKLYETSK